MQIRAKFRQGLQRFSSIPARVIPCSDQTPTLSAFYWVFVIQLEEKITHPPGIGVKQHRTLLGSH